MAFKSRAISVFLLLSIFFAMATHVVAGRVGPTEQKEDDRKQPEWFIEPDGSVLIPGIGRILVPMPGGGGSHGSSIPSNGRGGYNSPPNPGYSGSGSNSGSTHIPGGDDTFVPNPGYEVPVPSAP